MKVLVTGGAGYVGSICAQQLILAGHKVVILDDLSTGHRGALPKRAKFVLGDFADNRKIRKIAEGLGIEAVMHFGGATLVEKSMTDPHYYFKSNVQKGIQLLETLLDLGVKNFIFSSSAAVYGEPVSVPITETHPTQPINPYGESKLMFERILESHSRAYGLHYIALRYFNAAGATPAYGEDHRPETHLIPRLLDAARNSKHPFEVYGTDYPTPDGTCIRDFVHVLDIAQAHLLAMQALPKVQSAIYNIGHGKGHSIRAVLRAVKAVTGRPIQIKYGPRRPGDPAVLVASPRKIQQELKWKPRYSDLRTIVRSAWHWKQRHPSGYHQHG